MESEEAVGDAPGGDEGLTDLEEGGDPTGADVGIEGRQHVINHPEDGLAALGLTEIIALTSVMHLLNGQMAGSDDGRKEIEVICTAGLDHRHGGDREIDASPDFFRIKGLPNGLEGMLKQLLNCHVRNTDYRAQLICEICG